MDLPEVSDNFMDQSIAQPTWHYVRETDESSSEESGSSGSSEDGMTVDSSSDEEEDAFEG